jgi:hypothetical protein
MTEARSGAFDGSVGLAETGWKNRFMNLRAPLTVFLAALCAGSSWGADAPLQSRQNFEAAVRQSGIAERYVAVTIVDDRSGATRSICTHANLLEGAVHLEYGLGFGPTGSAEARRIVLSRPDHVFHFTKPAALANIPIDYSPEDLAIVREPLRGLSEAELRAGFSSRGRLNFIYDHEGLSMAKRHAYLEATACVLIERGLSPEMAHMTGQILIAREPTGVDDLTLPGLMPQVRVNWTP